MRAALASKSDPGWGKSPNRKRQFLVRRYEKGKLKKRWFYVEVGSKRETKSTYGENLRISREKQDLGIYSEICVNRFTELTTAT